MKKKKSLNLSVLENGRHYAMVSIFLTLVLGVLLWPSEEHHDNSQHFVVERHDYLSESRMIVPIVPLAGLDAEKIALGERLFSDPRMSGDNSTACANCHGLGNAGVDGLKVSIGVDGHQGKRNAPTVFNAALNLLQFWDGRVTSLEEQIDSPIENPLEMASSWNQIITKLEDDDYYKEAFSELYAKGITIDNIKNAIATFERSLVTPDSLFDRFLRGDDNAISNKAKAGFELFTNYGCISCHQGMNIGGNMFEKIGVMVPYYNESEEILENEDYGRFHLTGVEEHQYEFRVPSLRNVARTAPYFHDGRVATLDEAVKIMALHQLGLNLDQREIEQIVAFLQTLTGEYNGEPL